MIPILEPRLQCALVSNHEEVSYTELIRRVRAFGIHVPEPGARVVIFSENRPEWVYAAYAIWAAGCVLVPIDHLATAEELAYVVDDCQPAVVFCSQKTRATVERSLQIAARQPRMATLDALPCAISLADAPVDPIAIDEATLAAIVYTSGTTGSPKGVMLSFGNLLANVRPVVKAGYFTTEARVLLLLPLHHVLPLAGSLVAPLFGGSTIVLAGSMVGEELLALLRHYRITVIVGVPRFYDLLHRALRDRIDQSAIARRLFALAKRLRSRRLSRIVFRPVHRRFGGALEYLVCGGAALHPDTAETFDVLGFHMCEGYGMTECSPMISFPRPDRIRLGACGQALDGCEVRIADTGEILARGPNVMLGYYGRPIETAEILRDGWLHTGDTGRLDEQGFLYVTGRLKDIVVFASGKKLDPGTVEARFEGSPGVREVGVFLDGEILHAIIVPDWESIPVASRDAEHWLRREVVEPYNLSVSPYRRIARVTLVRAELPRTRLGKLRRHLLARIAEEVTQTTANSSEVDGPRDGATTRLVEFLAHQTGRSVHAASRLSADLGLDSLGRVELSVFVERAFGVTITETRLASFETVSDLARDVAEFRKEEIEAPLDVSWGELLQPKTPPLLPRSGWTHRALVYASRVAVRLLFRISARGQERLPQEPFILVPNHQTYLDGLFVAAYLSPGTALRTMFYAKERHVRGSGLRSLAQRCNTIIMDPEAGFLPSLQQLAAGLRRRNNLMIFPEGTRSPDGVLRAFKDSYAILARELGLPVVPVVIAGAHAVLPRGRRLPNLFCPITVKYLDAMRPNPGESPATFNARVRSCVQAELLLESQRTATPYGQKSPASIDTRNT